MNINLTDQLEEYVQPSKTYSIKNGRVSGWIDETEAMQQAIEKILNTFRFEWVIYSDGYGNELDFLIGKDFSLVKSEVERIVKEALSSDDRVLSVEEFEVVAETKDSLVVTFLVVSIFGAIQIERMVTL